MFQASPPKALPRPRRCCRKTTIIIIYSSTSRAFIVRCPPFMSFRPLSLFTLCLPALVATLFKWTCCEIWMLSMHCELFLIISHADARNGSRNGRITRAPALYLPRGPECFRPWRYLLNSYITMLWEPGISLLQVVHLSCGSLRHLPKRPAQINPCGGLSSSSTTCTLRFTKNILSLSQAWQ